MSSYASPLSSGKTSPKGFLRVFGKVFTGSGVIESSALTVSAQLTPDMTVKVSGSALDDNAVLIHSDGTFIQAWNEADVNITITANASGVTKTDAIVAYVDLTDYDASNANNPDSFKFIAVRRGGTDTGAPITAEIETVVSSNPYIVLAHVTVANGAASINSGNISDQRSFAQIVADRLEPIGPDQLAPSAVDQGKIDFSTFDTGTSNSYTYYRMGALWIAIREVSISATSGAGSSTVGWPTGIVYTDAISTQLTVVGTPASWDWSVVVGGNNYGSMQVYVWNKTTNSGTVKVNIIHYLTKKPS